VASFKNIIVKNPQGSITNGMRSDGNFILSATTDQSEWTLNPSFDLLNPCVLVGNKIGQICNLYFYGKNISEQQLDLSVPLFTFIPESFQPHTQVSCALQSQKDDITSKISSACITLDENTHSVFISNSTGYWEPNETIFGTFTYFVC
jgi:hypothetical protein